MPIAYNPTPKDGRAVADNNDLKVLKVVRLFGHLRRQEIAMAVWPKSSYKSANIMASRTVVRLMRAGMLLERPNSLGGTSLVLGARGVTRLKDANLEAQEGYELAVDGPQFFHRTLGTCYLLEKSVAGSGIFGEFAILKQTERGWSPLAKKFLIEKYAKVPDGLIMYSAESSGFVGIEWMVDWVEVESAYKPYEELKKAFALAVRTYLPLNTTGSIVLHKLVFVYDSRQGHERSILLSLKKFIAEELPKTKGALRDAFLGDIILAKCMIDPPLVWRGVEERTALDLMNEMQGRPPQDE
jgi:hypothetical protein